MIGPNNCFATSRSEGRSGAKTTMIVSLEGSAALLLTDLPISGLSCPQDDNRYRDENQIVYRDAGISSGKSIVAILCLPCVCWSICLGNILTASERLDQIFFGADAMLLVCLGIYV